MMNSRYMRTTNSYSIVLMIINTELFSTYSMYSSDICNIINELWDLDYLYVNKRDQIIINSETKEEMIAYLKANILL
jgi:hypothetical protein